MNASFRDSKWLVVALLAAIGFGLLVLTIGSIDQRMALLHREPRMDSPLSRNGSASNPLETPSDQANGLDSNSEERISESDSPEERIRKKFGMVKVGGVWLPATAIKGATGISGVGVSASAAADGKYSVPLYITTGKLPEGRAGERYQSRIKAVGGAPPYAWTIDRGSAAKSISLDRASGELSGTPSEADTKTVRIRVTDTLGAADIAEYKIRIISSMSDQTSAAVAQTQGASSAAIPSAQSPEGQGGDPAASVGDQPETTDPESPPGPLSISPTPLADAKVGEPYTAQLSAIGGTPPFAWSSLAQLPAGLTLTLAGALSGTPQTPGEFTLSIAVTDQAVQSATQSFALKVTAAAPNAVTHFTALVSLRRVAFTWENPADPAVAFVRIVRNSVNPPAHELDGLIVFEGQDTTALDASPPYGGSYYAAFALNTDEVASQPAHLAVALNPDMEPFADAVAQWRPLNANAFGQSSLPGIVLGPPQGGGLDGGSTYVASLGAASVDDPGGSPYGGSIVVTFDNNLAFDGPGADITIFENVFYIKGATGLDPNSRMMEPAIVSVSQDGVTWHTFPFDFSPRYDAKTGALNLRHPFVYNKGFAGVNPVMANGYNVDPTDPSVSGGDSFDLADLHVPGLNWIRYVRIQSTGEKWLIDSDGELVRHPNTKAFSEASRSSSSAGFDLDAVTAIWLDAVR